MNADTPRAVPLLLCLIFWWVTCGAFTTAKQETTNEPASKLRGKRRRRNAPTWLADEERDAAR